MFDMGEEHIKDSISSTGKKWRLKTNRRVIKINPITQKTSEPGWGGYGGGRVSTRAEVQMGTIWQKPNHVLTVEEYRPIQIKSQYNTLSN